VNIAKRFSVRLADYGYGESPPGNETRSRHDRFPHP
jgi:hypothetical protein